MLLLCKVLILSLFLLLLCRIDSDRNPEKDINGSHRIALVITLSGQEYLSKYFEWSCRSIGVTSELIDMVVFHEDNTKVKEVTCANNVKFVNIGKDGFSHIVSRLMMTTVKDHGDVTSQVSLKRLETAITQIIKAMPRFLVEIKPMLGTLLRPWLQPDPNHPPPHLSIVNDNNNEQQRHSRYTHWSYSDPDILWGDIHTWLTPEELSEFDVISIAKSSTASTLFLRGQLSVHSYTNEALVSAWRELPYLEAGHMYRRIRKAIRGLSQARFNDRDLLYNRLFFSAEGYYSRLILDSPRFAVKIVGRCMDDFNSRPVLWHRGRLSRCISRDIEACVRMFTGVDAPAVVARKQMQMMPHVVPKAMQAAHFNDSVCGMHWLPKETRACLVKKREEMDFLGEGRSELEKREREKEVKMNHHITAPDEDQEPDLYANNNNKNGDNDNPRDGQPDADGHMDPQQYTMPRVNEAWSKRGSEREWFVNDETMAKRSVRDVTVGYFHFRHWDDVLSNTTRTSWGGGEEGEEGEMNGSKGLTHRSSSKVVQPECMIIYIGVDHVMAYETCELAITRKQGVAHRAEPVPRDAVAVRKGMKDLALSLRSEKMNSYKHQAKGLNVKRRGGGMP
jgi:hypothetical protein